MPQDSVTWFSITKETFEHTVLPGFYLVRASQEGRDVFDGCSSGVPIQDGYRLVGLLHVRMGPRGGRARPRWVSCEKGGFAHTWLNAWFRKGNQVELLHVGV